MSSVPVSTETTQILIDLSKGERSAASRLIPLVYDELRALAGRYMQQERPSHSLQATALVHEAYLKLIDQSHVDWKGRAHFFAVAAMDSRVAMTNARRNPMITTPIPSPSTDANFVIPRAIP